MFNDDFWLENNSYREEDALDYDSSFYNLMFNLLEIKEDDNVLLDSTIMPYSYCKFIKANPKGKNGFVDRINKLPLAAFILFKCLYFKFGPNEDHMESAINIVRGDNNDFDLTKYNKRFYLYNYNYESKAAELASTFHQLHYSTKTVNSAWYGLFKAAKELGDNDKACVVVPRNILSSANKADDEKRKFLLDHGYLETIVGFGEKVTVYPDSNVPIALVVLSKNNDKVNLIEASNLGEIKMKKVSHVNCRTFNEDDSNKIVDAIGTNQHGFSYVSYYKDAMDPKYPYIDLNPSVVVTLGIETFTFGETVRKNKKGKYLIQRGRQIRAKDLSKYVADRKTNVQIIKVDNLKEGFVYFDSEEQEIAKGCYLDISDEEFDSIFGEYEVHDGDMLMSKSVIPCLQTAIFDFDFLPEEKRNMRFVILDGLYTIKLHREEEGIEKCKHNPYYIQYYSSSDEGKMYTNYYATGSSTLRFISKKNLVCLEIPYAVSPDEVENKEDFDRLNYEKECRHAKEYKSIIKKMIDMRVEYNELKERISDFKL